MEGNLIIKLEDEGSVVNLRRSLLWDVPIDNINLKKNKKLIIERVFTRGNISEFEQVVRFYGQTVIKSVLLDISQMDNKTLNFVSSTFNIPKSKFKCYVQKQ